jgi:replication initiation and membrane attachment protein DnaB
VAVAEPIRAEWLKSVLIDRGYLAKLKGESIKVYLAMLEACGGTPDQSVTISLSQLMARTELTCPTVIDGLGRLEALGLVVSTTHEKGKVKTYYVPDPPSPENAIAP